MVQLSEVALPVHQPSEAEHPSTSALRRRRRIANALVAAALMLFGMLLLYPPTQFGFYPSCPIHQLFGIECPGCGATRALAALLRGNVVEAAHLNLLFVLLVPFALAGTVEFYRRAIRPGIFRWPQLPAPALYAILTAAAIFTIARNMVH